MGKKNQQKLQRSLRYNESIQKLSLPKNRSESGDKNEIAQVKLSADHKAEPIQSKSEKPARQKPFERLGRIIFSSVIIFGLLTAAYVLDQKNPFMTDLGDWLYFSLKLNE